MTAHRPDRQVGGTRRLDEVAGDLVADLRFHREAEKLHRLGPRPYGELLAEIGEQFMAALTVEEGPHGLRCRKYRAGRGGESATDAREVPRGIPGTGERKDARQ